MQDPYGLDASQLPPELIAQLLGNRSRKQIAEAMLKQSMQAPEVQQPKGRFQGAVSPLEYLAKMTQGVVGRRGMDAADAQQQRIAGVAEQGRAGAMRDYQSTKAGLPGVLPNDDEGNAMPGAANPRKAIMDALGNAYLKNSPFLKWEMDNLNKTEGREDQQAFLREQRAESARDRAERERAAHSSQMARDRERAADKEALLRIAQSNRPAPPPDPVTPIDVVEDGRVVKKDARTGRVLGISTNDAKVQGAYNQDTASLQSSTAELDRLGSTANELKNHPGLEGITGLKGAFPNMPGGDAANAQAKLNTLKSQVAFGVLQAMRNASKTGGALGNVSDAEGKRLEANLAALENAQSYDQFRASLAAIVKFTEEAKDRLRGAYNLKHGEKGGSQPAGLPDASAIDAELKRRGK